MHPLLAGHVPFPFLSHVRSSSFLNWLYSTLLQIRADSTRAHTCTGRTCFFSFSLISQAHLYLILIPNTTDWLMSSLTKGRPVGGIPRATVTWYIYKNVTTALTLMIGIPWWINRICIIPYLQLSIIDWLTLTLHCKKEIVMGGGGAWHQSGSLPAAALWATNKFSTTKRNILFIQSIRDTYLYIYCCTFTYNPRILMYIQQYNLSERESGEKRGEEKRRGEKRREERRREQACCVLLCCVVGGGG